jgi:RNA polymerase sigma-70 factor, ECF subfamily
MLGVEDRELAEKVALGDGEAIGTFVDRFYGPVFRFLWHASGSREDAEDLTSQALLRARMDIRNFRGDGPLAAWIYRVARREFLRFRRRQVLTFGFAGHRAPQAADEPSEDVVVIQQALALLPSNHRTAFLLTEVEGLSTEEASLALGVPPGTVKSRCYHARKRLREILGPAYPEVSNYAQPIPD